MKKFDLVKIIGVTFGLTTLFVMSNFARGWETDGFDWQYLDVDGQYVTDTIKRSGEDRYYLDFEGVMVRDYLLENYNDATYYFDDNGKMVKNTWVAVDPAQVVNAMDNPPTIYLYYFGPNGKAYRSMNGTPARKVIDGKKYFFNENGQMLFGWLNEQGERYDDRDVEKDPFDGFCYYAGDETDGVLREGWSEYIDGSVKDEYYLKPTLWFYFSLSTNKKVCAENDSEAFKKKINGHYYAFDSKGVMIQGWDSDMIESDTTKNYYGETEERLGHMYKGEWVFTAPSKLQDEEDHDDDVGHWFYLLNDGNYAKSETRKINSKYYIFDSKGIMKTGLCIVSKSGKKAFHDCIDTERTDGLDFIISRYYISADDDFSYDNSEGFNRFDDKLFDIYYFETDEESKDYGAKKYDERIVHFGDDDYVFCSKASGQYEGYKKKKYYQAGISLKADKTLGLGLVFIGYSSSSNATIVDRDKLPIYKDSTHPWAKPYYNHLGALSDYIVINNAEECYDKHVYPVFVVVDKNGKLINKANSVRKDSSGRYWAIGANSRLIDVYDIQVRFSQGGGWQFLSEKEDPQRGTAKKTWFTFRATGSEADIYQRRCYTNRFLAEEAGDSYSVKLENNMALNFRFAD